MDTGAGRGRLLQVQVDEHPSVQGADHVYPVHELGFYQLIGDDGALDVESDSQHLERLEVIDPE